MAKAHAQSQKQRWEQETLEPFLNKTGERKEKFITVSNEPIQPLYTQDDLDGGDLSYDMRTRENLELAAGLYIFVLETPAGERKSGKFVIIR